jgi:hypothetical protein
MSKVDPDLLSRLDIRTALDTEASGARRDLLPVQVGDLAAQASLAEVEAIIATRAQQGKVGTEPAPVLSASKWRHGRRPAAALALPERVLYRATAQLLGDGLAGERQDDDHTTFINAPVNNDEKFIIVTDLANYYSSIQIDRLADILLSRTGEWSIISWLRHFLLAISPDIGGLPQGNYASDRLADTYADTLLRKLRRRGLCAWRYADDFRIGASSYQNAINALEIFDEEVRAMGLFVNERKTYVVGQDKYIANRDREVEFFTSAWQEKRQQLTTIDIYRSEPVLPENVEVYGAVALEELQAWASEVESRRANDEKEIPTRLDLGLVLTMLTLAKEPDALAHVPELLLMEPQLAHLIARYLYTISTDYSDRVDAAISKMVQDFALGKWKAVWLCYSLTNIERANLSPLFGTRKPKSPLVSGVGDWLNAQARSRDEVLSAQAVWSLAVNGALTKDVWSDLNSRPGTYSAQFTAAALGRLSVPDKHSLDSGDKFDKLVRNWAESFS